MRIKGRMIKMNAKEEKERESSKNVAKNNREE